MNGDLKDLVLLMMIVLLDEPTIEIFESADHPPSWIETIDVVNGEYRFCDDDGQLYQGVVTDPPGWFRPARFALRPVGTPDAANALALVDQATTIVPNARFPDLAALRNHILNRRDLV